MDDTRAPGPHWTAPAGPRFEGVRRIAVLRGGGLGDLMFTLPAIAALRAAYPGASIELLGTPGGAALIQGRGVVDAAHPLPLVDGIREAPGRRADPDEVEAYLERMRGRRFDLALQLTGGGRNSNPFLLATGARYTVGAATDDAAALTRTIPYRYWQHEVLRHLEVASLAGAPIVELEPRLPRLESDAVAAQRLLQDAFGDDRGPLVVLHPGATDPRRRWPAESFGGVAAALAADGARVLVVGDASDVPAGERIAAAASPRTVSLAGRLQLGELAGLLGAADAVVANDSGPRHIAQALGTPTVTVFWFGNVVNAAPFSRTRHRILLGFTTRCPVCGADVTEVGWSAQRCEHDPSFVADVRVDEVLGEVRSLLGAAPPDAPAG